VGFVEDDDKSSRSIMTRGAQLPLAWVYLVCTRLVVRQFASMIAINPSKVGYLLDGHLDSSSGVSPTLVVGWLHGPLARRY
jgi:hypothetical protein